MPQENRGTSEAVPVFGRADNGPFSEGVAHLPHAADRGPANDAPADAHIARAGIGAEMARPTLGGVHAG